MRINYSGLLSKILLLIKHSYWAWLFLCFFHWFFLAFATFAGPDEMSLRYKPFSNFFRFAFDNEFGSFLFISSLYTPIIFIAISIVRRKFSIWELGVIAATLSLMFYVFPHLRG